MFFKQLPEIVAAQDDSDNVLADVVDVALDRGQHHRTSKPVLQKDFLALSLSLSLSLSLRLSNFLYSLCLSLSKLKYRTIKLSNYQTIRLSTITYQPINQ